MSNEAKLALGAGLLFAPLLVIALTHQTYEERSDLKRILREKRRCPRGKWNKRQKRCRVRLCPAPSC